MSLHEAAYPLRTTRNHWMNWVETHATMRPDAPAFRYLGRRPRGPASTTGSRPSLARSAGAASRRATGCCC